MPNSAAAPTAEKSSASASRSPTITGTTAPRRRHVASANAEKTHTIAFATTKYLHIWFFVDDVPIRVFKNSSGDLGVRYPFSQPMKLYSSLWNADDWATRGGREKTDWSNAPFVASYRGFHVDGCEASAEARFCATQGARWWDQPEFRDLDGAQYRKLREVRQRYTIYNYCTDRDRNAAMPPECAKDRDV